MTTEEILSQEMSDANRYGREGRSMQDTPVLPWLSILGEIEVADLSLIAPDGWSRHKNWRDPFTEDAWARGVTLVIPIKSLRNRGTSAAGWYCECVRLKSGLYAGAICKAWLHTFCGSYTFDQRWVVMAGPWLFDPSNDLLQLITTMETWLATYRDSNTWNVKPQPERVREILALGRSISQAHDYISRRSVVANVSDRKAA